MRDVFFQQTQHPKFDSYASNGTPLTPEEANKLKHGEMFDSLISRQDTWDACDSLPLLNKDLAHILIPFSYDLHHEISFGSGNLEEELTSFFNEWFSKEKFFLSCDKFFFFALRLNDFSYDHVDCGFEAGGFNSHFVLFDKRKDRWVVFYCRFPFITVSWRNTAPPPIISGRQPEDWRDYFQEKASQAFMLQSDAFLDFINKTYIPRIQGYDLVKR